MWISLRQPVASAMSRQPPLNVYSIPTGDPRVAAFCLEIYDFKPIADVFAQRAG